MVSPATQVQAQAQTRESFQTKRIRKHKDQIAIALVWTLVLGVALLVKTRLNLLQAKLKTILNQNTDLGPVA